VYDNTENKLPEIPLRGETAILALLYDVTQEFSSSLELSEVLGKVLTLTVQYLRANRGSVFLLDSQGRVVQHILARQHLPLEVREELVSTVMDKGLAGWVYRHRRGAVVNDTENDERWHTFADDNGVARSAMATPLVRRGDICGIITLEQLRPNAFTIDDVQLLTTIAQQAVIAIENARMFTQISKERDTVEAVLNGVRDAILVVDEQDFVIVMVNPAAATLLRVAPDEAVGHPISDFLTQPALFGLLYNVTEEQSQTAEMEFFDRGYFHVNVSQIPRVGRVVALHDITYFKELDDMKSEFVATVSHDLKGPLSLIMGYAWILGEESDLSESQREFVNLILSSGQRMERLVSNLLDLAKIEAGVDSEREICLLPSLFGEVADEHRVQAQEKSIDLQLTLPEDVPFVVANRIRLGQALGNLVSNAIKYTRAGGRVVVSVRAQPHSVIISVTDNGLGISLQDQTKLFQKFSRVGGEESLRMGGTGLGLAIVKSVVESHNGRVWVESELGVGSSFKMELPITEENQFY